MTTLGRMKDWTARFMRSLWYRDHGREYVDYVDTECEPEKKKTNEV